MIMSKEKPNKIKKILMIEDVDLSINTAPKMHFLNLAKEFANLGFLVCGILPQPQKKLDFDVNKLPFKIIFTPTPFQNIHIAGNILKCFLQLPVIIKELLKGPKLVYIRFFPLAIIPCLWISLIKKIFYKTTIKVIGEVNGWIPDEWKVNGVPLWRIIFVKYLLKCSTHLVDNLLAVTTGTKNIFIRETGIDPNKIFVVGNGTDIELFKPLNKKKAKGAIGLNSNLLVVGFIGYLAKWQGIEKFINCIPIVLKQNPNVSFLIVGDGPELQRLKKKTKQLNIADNVIFTGEISYKQVPIYINSFNVGVAPFIINRNQKIGLSPLKVRDYAACGVPIIASRIKGMELIQKYDIGILVNPKDHQAWAETILALLKNPQKRKEMGRKARRLAEQKFSWSIIAKAIIKEVS